VCIGETLEERESSRTLDVLRPGQIKEGLTGCRPPQVAGLVIAYEPVWAIGTGRNATPQQAQEAHAHIRDACASGLGPRPRTSAAILYGAASRPNNIRDLRAQPDVDGALVGGASLDPKGFSAIVRDGSRR